MRVIRSGGVEMRRDEDEFRGVAGQFSLNVMEA
jgi:hypothetical protein